jgi:hypothetical protein
MGISTGPKRDPAKALVNKLSRNNFNLMNKAGQLGRQGVKGPAEMQERRGLLGPATHRTKKKKQYKPRIYG